MKPQKLQRSATWWQIVWRGKLLGGTDRPTKKACIEGYVRSFLPVAPLGKANESWKSFAKTRAVECVKVTAFWGVSK